LYLLLGLLYVTALGEVLLHCHSHFLGIKINIKIVGALRALVFENTISQPEHFPGHAAGSYDSESGKKRMAEVAHLYAEDVLNVARMVTHMQFLWRSVLQIVFELCIMVQVIGIKFKPVAFAFLFMAVFAKFLSAAGGRLRRKLQKKVEARLNVIHECFKGIQMVKLNAWEGKMQEKIDRARKEENCERRKVNMVAALQYCVGVDSPNLASIFIFGCFQHCCCCAGSRRTSPTFRGFLTLRARARVPFARSTATLTSATQKLALNIKPQRTDALSSLVGQIQWWLWSMPVLVSRQKRGRHSWQTSRSACGEGSWL